DLVLPTAPLGEMHGAAAARALELAGARVQTGARVDDLAELDADAVVLALPPEDASRLLGENWTFDHSPIVSVHLLFDRVILRQPMAALLGSDAHWIFDRSALTGRGPSEKGRVRDSGPVEGGRGERGGAPVATGSAVSDCRLERRAGAVGDPGPRGGRPDRGSGDRAARSRGRPLVPCEQRAGGHDRRQAGTEPPAGCPRRAD